MFREAEMEVELSAMDLIRVDRGWWREVVFHDVREGRGRRSQTFREEEMEGERRKVEFGKSKNMRESGIKRLVEEGIFMMYGGGEGTDHGCLENRRWKESEVKWSLAR